MGAGAQEDCQEKNWEVGPVAGQEGTTGEAGGNGSQSMGRRGKIEGRRGIQGHQDLEQRESAGHQEKKRGESGQMEADEHLDMRGCIPSYLKRDGCANRPERKKNHIQSSP